MNKMKKIIPLAGLFLLMAVITVTAGMTLQVNAKTEENRISDGIYIEGLHLGGMTADEAEKALTSYVKDLEQVELTLKAGEKEVIVTAGQMGFAVSSENMVQEAMDIGKTGSLLKRYKDLKDLEYGDLVLKLDTAVDASVITAFLDENASEINTKAVNHGLIRENGQFTFVEGTTGIAVNVEQSVSLIQEYMTTEWDYKEAAIELAAEIAEPLGTKEELAKVKDLLGSYSTSFSSSAAGRCTNIEVASGRINGTILYPGEEFSVNETILQRTKDNGYELGGAYVNGETVQSYGGGVCQVSTTLYNAVILAELKVLERSAHSMTVSYVPVSMDAAIAGDYMDFKFVNNTDTPIYIEGYTKNKNLYFNVYGEETRPSNRKVSYVSETVSKENPPTKYVATSSPIGTIKQVQSGHTGYKARLWKVVTVNGVEESRTQFNNSNYRSSQRTVHVGTASADPNATAAVNAAIATGDEATIRSVVAQYTAPATPPAPQTPAETPAVPETPTETPPAAPAVPETPAETPAAPETPAA